MRQNLADPCPSLAQPVVGPVSQHDVKPDANYVGTVPPVRLSPLFAHQSLLITF